MLYGENYVQNDAFTRWVNNLELPSLEEIAQIIPGTKAEECKRTQDILQHQLELLKEEADQLKPEDDWRNLQGIFSHYFYSLLVRHRNNAIRIGNYYECFIRPADPTTSKAIVGGYPDHSMDIGGVRIFEKGNFTGHIGEKSDVIWSAYYDYFVVARLESMDIGEGEIEYWEERNHTLANHEEILSLQLWNTENMSDDELDNYINKILLEVSAQYGLKFRLLIPDDAWKSKGIEKQYRLDLPEYQYDETPALYLNNGLNSTDDRMSFLLLYQVLEYYYVHAQTSLFKEELGAGGIEGKTDYELHKALLKYSQAQKELVSLSLVIKHCIDPNIIRKYVCSTERLRAQYSHNPYGKNDINLNLESGNNEKLMDRLASRIYFFRCAIAHAKGDTGEHAVYPTINKSEVTEELPLLRIIAFEVLKKYSCENIH